MTFIRIYYRLGDFLSICLSIMPSLDIFTRSFDDFISMKFLFAVFLPASPFIPTSLFINFRNQTCQPPRLLHPPRLLFWPKSASLPVYSALPFYLKLESTWLTSLCLPIKLLTHDITSLLVTASCRIFN